LKLLLLAALFATRPFAAEPVDADLAAFGAALDESDPQRLTVLFVEPGSRAADLGLKPGDALLSVAGSPTRSRAETAGALRRWTTSTRLSAVARRGETVLPLGGAAPSPEPAYDRDASELSAHETSLRDALRDDVSGRAQASVKAAPPLELKVAARQAFWLGFPNGVPGEAAAGDVLVGETTTAVATNENLDYLSVPARSRVWCRVVAVKKTAETRELRLLIYKIQPEGGHVYPAIGWITAVAGNQKQARVSSGGTLVLAAPAQPQKGSTPILTADARLRAELASSIALTEGPAFYRAGPGLWIRTKESPEGRKFEVSHVIAGRAAAAAGVKVGDVIESLGGKPASRLDFAAALGQLYGEPGSKVRLRLGGKDLELLRGVVYKNGQPSVLPLPFLK
jgi:membrane-associated protease RseP (regulator of RpoE activity)